MQQNFISKCSICQDDLSKDSIPFNCGHSFCFQCFPYILYNTIQINGITGSFFKDLNSECPCLICQTGKSIIPFTQLGEFFNKYYINKNMRNPTKTQAKCEACENNNAIIRCMECNLDYCDKCWADLHKAQKIFMTHKMDSLEQIDCKAQSQCKCLFKQRADVFCLECQSAFCNFCIFTNHKDHNTLPLAEILHHVKQRNISDDSMFINNFWNSSTNSTRIC